MTTMEELMLAALQASEERKAAALRALRGEAVARPATPPLLLGMSAGARYLGVSRSTLWRILQIGTIKKIELFPGAYRVQKVDLEDLAAGKYVSTANPSRRGVHLRGRGRQAAVKRPMVEGAQIEPHGAAE